MVDELRARIVFEPEYRVPEAFRGLECFSHIWVVWQFSLAGRGEWRPTVRPPRLGGNRRMGVFATRSPFRPNALGLSSVRLLGIDYDCAEAPVLCVAGTDMVSGTPVYDVKPYLPYTDSHPEATGGFTDEIEANETLLAVTVPPELMARVPEDKREALVRTLECDPRPRYQDDDGRVYGMAFAGLDVRFSVSGRRLTVVGAEPIA